MKKQIKPSFFVVGAQKAGTTTLHEWLRTSSEVALPKNKETHFFSDATRYCLGFDWYQKNFSEDAWKKHSIVGEVDPDYMFFPEAALRIKKINEAPKFIFILREPFSRARSQYLMSVYKGYEKKTFIEALKLEGERCSSGNYFNMQNFSYIGRSLYCEHIIRFKETFPDSEFLFVKYDDLFSIESHSNQIKRICTFLGIDWDNLRIDVAQKNNQASRARSLIIQRLIEEGSYVRSIAKQMIPWGGVRRKLLILLSEMNKRPLNEVESKCCLDEISDSIRKLVFLDMQKTEKLTGLDFTDWIWHVSGENQNV